MMSKCVWCTVRLAGGPVGGLLQPQTFRPLECRITQAGVRGAPAVTAATDVPPPGVQGVEMAWGAPHRPLGRALLYRVTGGCASV